MFTEWYWTLGSSARSCSPPRCRWRPMRSSRSKRALFHQKARGSKAGQIKKLPANRCIPAVDVAWFVRQIFEQKSNKGIFGHFFEQVFVCSLFVRLSPVTSSNFRTVFENCVIWPKFVINIYVSSKFMNLYVTFGSAMSLLCLSVTILPGLSVRWGAKSSLSCTQPWQHLCYLMRAMATCAATTTTRGGDDDNAPRQRQWRRRVMQQDDRPWRRCE